MERLAHGHSVTMAALLALAASLASLDAAAAVRAPAFQVRARETEPLARTLATKTERSNARVWVFFTDKALFDSESTARRLAGLARSLDKHALERRAKSIGPDLVDFYDIPVADLYVRAIEQHGGEVYRRSYWLNAVSVDARPSELASIAEEPFVQKIVPVRDVRVSPDTTIGEDMWIASAEAADATGTAEITAPRRVDTTSPITAAIEVAHSRGLVVHGSTLPIERSAKANAPRADREPLFAAASLAGLSLVGTASAEDLEAAAPDVPVQTEAREADASDAPRSWERARSKTVPVLVLTATPGKARVRLAYEVPSHLGGSPVVDILADDGSIVRSYAVNAVDGSLTWDGRDAHGRASDSGLYSVRLRVGEWMATGRIRVAR